MGDDMAATVEVQAPPNSASVADKLVYLIVRLYVSALRRERDSTKSQQLIKGKYWPYIVANIQVEDEERAYSNTMVAIQAYKELSGAMKSTELFEKIREGRRPVG